MKLNRVLLGAIAVVGGMLATGSTLVNAQDSNVEGIVRISDIAPGQSAPCNTGGQPGMTGCPNGQCGNGQCGNGQYGPCGNGSCGHGYGRCYHRCSCTGHIHNLLSWLDPLGGCTLPPDHGWAPPGKVPMWRRPVTYTKFYPDGWTGQPGFPAVPGMPRPGHVYMPTDTTQLGHYYQTVPQWLPVHGMVPGAPNPNDWHQPLCTQNAGIVVGASAESVLTPTSAPVVTPEATPAAPPAPVADLSSAGETPTLQPIPR